MGNSLLISTNKTSILQKDHLIWNSVTSIKITLLKLNRESALLVAIALYYDRLNWIEGFPISVFQKLLTNCLLFKKLFTIYKIACYLQNSLIFTNCLLFKKLFTIYKIACYLQNSLIFTNYLLFTKLFTIYTIVLPCVKFRKYCHLRQDQKIRSKSFKIKVYEISFSFSSGQGKVFDFTTYLVIYYHF